MCRLLCKKEESFGSAEDLARQYEWTRIWTAIDASTRLIITFWIGGRELENARRIPKDLTERCIAKPLFVSDELPHFIQAIDWPGGVTPILSQKDRQALVFEEADAFEMQSLIKEVS